MELAAMKKVISTSQQQLSPYCGQDCVEALQNADLDLHPWAGYTLGLQSQYLPYWLELAILLDRHEGFYTEDAIPLAIKHLRCAKRVLVNDASPIADQNLEQALSLTQSIWDKYYNPAEGQSFDHFKSDFKNAFDEVKVSSLQIVQPNKQLCKWYELGKSIANLDTYDIFDHQDMNELIKNLMNAFNDIPSDARSDLLILNDLYSIWCSFKADVKLSQFYRKCKKEFGKKYPSFCWKSVHKDFHFGFSALISDLALQELKLRLFNRHHCSAPAHTLKPFWDKDRGLLLYGDQTIRTVRVGTGEKIVEILDQFQKADWPPRISDPGLNSSNKRGLDSRRHHDWIKSLNTKLIMIRFSSDGTGKGIRWSGCD
jgi:hypothetical protein